MTGPTKGEIEHARWIIDGSPFTKVSGVYGVAKEMCPGLTLSGLTQRPNAGARTWEELTRPLQKGHGPEMVAKQNAIRQRKRDEMAELIAALDQRKRDMGVS